MQVIETIFAIVAMNIIFWKNAALLLPETIELKYVIGGCILLSLPTNWLKDFQARTRHDRSPDTGMTAPQGRVAPSRWCI